MAENQLVVPTAFGEMRHGHCAVDEVMTLQSFLTSLGYCGDNDKPLSSGHFDDETMRAVARLQQERLGQPASGELDPLTRLGISELMQLEAVRARPSGFYTAVAMLFEGDEPGDGAGATLREAQTSSMIDLHARTQPPVAEDIRRAQDVLLGRGFNLGDTGADGICGPLTTAALRVYQMELGLHPVGMINGHYDVVTGSFLQIDEDEMASVLLDRQGPQMQYVRTANDLPPAEEPEQSRIELLRKLLGEITSENRSGETH